MKTNAYDYVIVGSGSAGSAMAYRLSESGQHSVAVLEFGGSDFGPYIQMPAALSYPMNMPRYDWGYRTESEAFMDHRVMHCPRGKVIGGSSSINGMIFVRGHAEDFNTWSRLGAEGWSYEEVLPYFKRMETSHGSQSAYRGQSGPLHITRVRKRSVLNEAIVEAAGQAGYAHTPDYNGSQQEGFGSADCTIWGGKRMSAAKAYLRPALKRDNVVLIKRALVDRIEFNGKRAQALSYVHQGQLKRIRALKEIIVCAGSINSPMLMQRSGIGDAAWLRKLGIEPVVDNAFVGANLQDHLEVYVQLHCKQPVTLYPYWNLGSKALIGLQWLLFSKGIGASNHFDTLGFVRSSEKVSYPDIQFHFLPIAIRYDGRSAAEGHGFQLHVGPMRSGSRGHVRIQDKNPTTPPSILFNYMSLEQDWQVFRKCLRISRNILTQPAMEAYLGEEIQPGSSCQSDDQLDAFVRQNAESAYHPCGTLRMGGEQAVVDAHCRVLGVEGLRVVDASIFPTITNGNTNAPSIMVAERAADLILGRNSLGP